jgi:hypothetical protein
MKTIENKVLEGYNKGLELNRLRKDLGLIEFERTKELLLEYLPPVPAVIYDIGGGRDKEKARETEWIAQQTQADCGSTKTKKRKT